MTPLVPLDLPDHAGHDHGLVEPLLGLDAVGLVLVTLLATFLLLRSRGVLPPLRLSSFLGSSGVRPEDSAKQILAERLAHGDLSPEEFMERASALSWTPGGDVVRSRAVGRG